MVDILCTRCGATDQGFTTYYQAKFSLVHKEKCGAKIGVPKYSTGTKTTEAITTTGNDTETIVVSTLSDTPKPKKKKAKKKADS